MRFVVLGDLHFSSYPDLAREAARDRVFGTFFRQVAALKADLVFAVGDTTHTGTFEEFESQNNLAAKFGLPLIRLTGNHDSDFLEKAEMAPFYLGELSPVSGDELYTRFDSGPARLLLLDTSRVKMTNENWSGLVSPAQLNWLKNEISLFNHATSPEFIILLGHHPIANTTARSEENWLNIDNSLEVREILQGLKRTPGLYICGHNHINSIFGPDPNNWYFLQAGAPMICESFRLVEVSPREIKIETIDFDLAGPGIREDLEFIRTNMEHFSFLPLEIVRGAEKDRSLTIELDVV